MNKPSSIPEIGSINSREQLEEVYDILEQVFPRGRAFFQERLDNDSTYDMDTTWAASVDGKIASTVQLFPFHSRIEDASVKIGGIGSVGTLPDYRGMGLVQGILKRQVEWMAEQEYDLSLLFAVITPFYEKAGWSVVPEPIYELAVSAMPQPDAGSEGQQSGDEYDIAAFSGEHLEAIADIYEQFNRTRTYSVIRPASFWGDQLKWPRAQSSACLVARKDGRVVAYGYIDQEHEGKVYLEELAYLPGEEAAAVPLFRALLALRPAAEKALAKLPGDHALLTAFLAWGAWRQTLTFSMWKVIRLQPLLHKLRDVFARRLAGGRTDLDGGLRLHIVCAEQHAYLHTDADAVAVAVESSPRAGAAYEQLALSQEQLVYLLLQGVGEDAPAELQSDLLRTLFPPQNFIFYLTDKF